MPSSSLSGGSEESACFGSSSRVITSPVTSSPEDPASDAVISGDGHYDGEIAATDDRRK